MKLRIVEKREIAEGIFLFGLEASDGSDLPAFNAGSHILVTTPSGHKRRYSLCSAPSQRRTYQLAVKHEINGEGGSKSMIADAVLGAEIDASAPENYFSLNQSATTTLLIAGGIGITPILAMATTLSEQRKPFELLYCSRSADTTAFLNEIKSSSWSRDAHFHHDEGDPAKSLNFATRLAQPTQGIHLYCCGPRPLMQAVRDATKDWPKGTVHFEDFGTSQVEQEGGDRTFRVKLARSGRTIEVPPGSSIIDALRAHGIDAPSSCESGTCGTCRTALLDGVADHRDFVLDEDEHQDNIMICISRAKFDEITIDL